MRRPSPVWTRLFYSGGILLLWEAVGRGFEIHPELLPTPARILLEITEQSARLRSHGIITGVEILGGFLLAVACSIPATILLFLAPQSGRKITPILMFLRPAPMVILAPVIFVWLDSGCGRKYCLLFRCASSPSPLARCRDCSRFPRRWSTS